MYFTIYRNSQYRIHHFFTLFFFSFFTWWYGMVLCLFLPIFVQFCCSSFSSLFLSSCNLFLELCVSTLRAFFESHSLYVHIYLANKAASGFMLSKFVLDNSFDYSTLIRTRIDSKWNSFTWTIVWIPFTDLWHDHTGATNNAVNTSNQQVSSFY